jgi:hypothetical protein
MKLPIVAERPQAGPFKTVASALTSQALLPNGQLELRIEHSTVRGVTPSMLRWWFENLGGEMALHGQAYPRYLLWHPKDHIHWELAKPSSNGGSGAGAFFRIVEAFDANPDHYVDSIEYVERLDESGISLVKRLAGVEVFRLEHSFSEAQGGTSYRSRMVIGATPRCLSYVVNRCLRPWVFSDAMATAWLTHNIEEVGMLEHILPGLYSAK